jgi:bacterioferritin-associated ferredoxin
MYVCVCNAVTDRKIREAVDNGCNSMSNLRKELEVATCCGKCETRARELLAECLAKVDWPLAAPAAAPT